MLCPGRFTLVESVAPCFYIYVIDRTLRSTKPLNLFTDPMFLEKSTKQMDLLTVNGELLGGNSLEMNCETCKTFRLNLAVHKHKKAPYFRLTIAKSSEQFILTYVTYLLCLNSSILFIHISSEMFYIFRFDSQ